MERAAKESMVAELKDIFSNSATAILVDYKGLEANKLVELRKALNGADSRMKIVKNTLARLASEGTPFESMKDQFVDCRALIVSDDPVKQAKVVSDFAKANDTLVIKAGILADGDQVSLLDVNQVKELASLPSKEELIAKLLFLFNAPITNFVRTLNEVPASFVRVLAAVGESKGEDKAE